MILAPAANAFRCIKPEHVIQFLFSEMGTTGSVDGAGRLVIKGRFQQKQVENVLRRYIGMLHKFPFQESSTILLRSRICRMQNLQINGHPTYQRESYLLHVMRKLRQSTQCQRN